MPWIFVPPERRRQRAPAYQRRRSRAYRAAAYQDRYNDRYDNGPYDAGPYADAPYDDGGDDFDDGADDDDFDGFYDRNGDRIDLTIQTPRDMLPPVVQRDDNDGYAPLRRRARF